MGGSWRAHALRHQEGMRLSMPCELTTVHIEESREVGRGEERVVGGQGSREVEWLVIGLEALLSLGESLRTDKKSVKTRKESMKRRRKSM